ncbi:hypothetical protein GA0061078_1431 [Bifidobacterium bohemicum]|uniref:Uncharacterized protein n=1 Tax=Bifidobacterium bohemicum DSM 22767 TaxID=1437606 RepID=A0A086ZH44_9BIFI|nr:hypothetical protein BBOH_0647 [Bifidobacterium bohemicum DSM 22767]SCC09552.1 hypothetical protein GA0061078_1431 [Bifidobacterium bohemicum]
MIGCEGQVPFNLQGRHHSIMTTEVTREFIQNLPKAELPKLLFNTVEPLIESTSERIRST